MAGKAPSDRTSLVEVLKGNAAGLDFSPLAGVVPGVKRDVEQRMIEDFSEVAAKPRALPSAAVPAGDSARPSLGTFKAGLERAMKMKNGPSSEEDLEKQMAERKKYPFGKKPKGKAKHENLLEEDEGIQDAAEKEKAKKAMSPADKENSRMMRKLQIMKALRDPEFRQDLEVFGIDKKILKMCTEPVLEKLTYEEMEERYKLVHMALSQEDDGESYVKGLETIAGIVEQGSMVAFQKLGTAPLNGLTESVKGDKRVRYLLKRYALENAGAGYTSAAQALMWELPKIAYQNYQQNQALINKSLQTATVPQEIVEEFKDL